MKTNVNVSTTKKQSSNYPAILKTVSVNPAMHPLKRLEKKPENRLSIQGFELREWLEQLSNSNGLYFLDMGNIEQSNYSLHFKHHASGKLMELDCQEELKDYEDPRKELLEILLFDLSLFPDEPVLVFDREETEKRLRSLAEIYYEHSRAIDSVIGRLTNIDMKKVFETGVYNDPRIAELSVDGVYRAFYPGSSRSFKEEGSSYAMYLIFLAIQNIFFQVTGKRIMV